MESFNKTTRRSGTTKNDQDLPLACISGPAATTPHTNELLKQSSLRPNVIPSALARLGMEGQFMASPQHHAFLPPDAATNALENIHQSHPRSQPIPHSTEMPISSDPGETLAAASELRKELQSKEVTPLHLLAVTMRRSHSRIQALRDMGITEEEVLRAIQKEAL